MKTKENMSKVSIEKKSVGKRPPLPLFSLTDTTQEVQPLMEPEMQKVGGTGDISLLFFLAGANFWAILGNFGPFWVIFGQFG